MNENRGEDDDHPMYQEEIEDLPNRWLYKRLLELDSQDVEVRIILEALKRSFGDYMAKRDEEDY